MLWAPGSSGNKLLHMLLRRQGQSSGQLRWGCLLAQAVPQNGPHTNPTRTADTPVLKVRLEELTAVVASDFAPYLQQVFPVGLPICIRAGEEQQWQHWVSHLMKPGIVVFLGAMLCIALNFVGETCLLPQRRGSCCKIHYYWKMWT